MNNSILIFNLDRDLGLELEQFVKSCKSDIEGMIKVTGFVQDKFPKDLLNTLYNIGLNKCQYDSITIKNLFISDCKNTAFIIHEVFSSFICGIKDVKFPYECHKEIYPNKEEGLHYSEWGNGYGPISLHSDDLYEKVDCDLLSLTTVINENKIPTSIVNSSEIISYLNDEEIEILKKSPAIFISGKNVNGKKIKSTKCIIEEFNGDVKYNLDFRIDKENGQRMKFINLDHQYIIDKMRNILNDIKPLSVGEDPGTFSVVNNKKVLHGRFLSLNKSFDKKTGERLLLRSKGQKINFNKYNREFS